MKRSAKELLGCAAVVLVRAVFLVSFMSLAVTDCAHAQSAIDPEFQGVKPYGMFQNGDIDIVSLINGTLQLNLPLWAVPQRGGKLKMGYVLRHVAPTYIEDKDCTQVPTCVFFYDMDTSDARGQTPGVQVVAETEYRVLQNLVQDQTGVVVGGYFVVEAPDGSTHELGAIGSNKYRAIDNSGFLFDAAANVLADAEGTHYFFSGAFSKIGTPITKIEDANGNRIEAATVNGVTGWLDTLGRFIPRPRETLIASNPPGNTSDFSGCNGPLPVTSADILIVPGSNGGTAQIKICYATIHIFTDLFGPPPPPKDHLEVNMHLLVIQNILLPNGTSWTFQFGSTDQSAVNDGELTGITFPTGGTLSYSWNFGNVCHTAAVFPFLRDVFVTTRTLDANDGTGPHTWRYLFPGQKGNYLTRTWTNTVTDPAGNDSLYTITGLNGTCSYYETQAQYFQGAASSNQVLKTETTQYDFHTDPNNDGLTQLNDVADVHPIKEVTMWPSGMNQQRLMTYDAGFTYSSYRGSPTSTASYGKVTSAQTFGDTRSLPGTLLQTIKTDYRALSDSTYLNTNNVNRLDLPSQVSVFAGASAAGACGANGAISCTIYGYDEASLASSGVTTERNTAPVNGTKRGNQTSVNNWLNGSTTATTNCNVSVSNGFLVSSRIYFDSGEVQKSTDPCGKAITFQYSSTYLGAFPTTVTNALNQNTTLAYDFNIGSVTSITDPNLQPTTTSYDVMARPTRVGYPDGGSITYCYTDVGGATCTQSGPPYSVVTTTAITSAPLNKISTANFDGLGRVFQTQLNSDTPSTTYTQISYDALGRKSRVYNPTRCSPPTSNCGETTWGFTTTNYDPLNRVMSVVEQDSSTVSTDYSAFPCTKVTDEAGKSRTSCMDGLGRLTQVFEDPGTSPHLNYETDYSYDALGNLLCVEQHGSAGTGTGCSSAATNDATSPWRIRRFTYNSLSQLLTAKNPESGTISYAYDVNGNVITKTAPKPNQTGTATVATTYAYDALNRLTQKSYNDGSTPLVKYGYDGTALSGCATALPALTDSNSKGRRTSMCDSSGATSWAHDQLGRTTTKKQTIVGSAAFTNSMLYSYNLNGSIATLTYPSGRIITYASSGAGRTLSAVESANSINYVAAATYAPQGALSGFLNGNSVHAALTYDSRLQPLQMYYTAAAISSATLTQLQASPCPSTAATIMGLSYNFGLGTNDNGNVQSITNCRDTNRAQNFVYDSLNRIKQAYTTGANWGEDFTIDAWGNLTNRSVHSGKTNFESLNVAPAMGNNRLTGFDYDAAGNMTSNGTAAYTYDAENRLTSTAGMSYVYDGDGQRVVKCSGTYPSCSAATLYWTGMGSSPLTEAFWGGNVKSEYTYFNGGRVARRDGAGNFPFYYFSDHLESSDVITGSAGVIQRESDYYPYGGEIVVSGSTFANNYKFTGKERDAESGLDNFGKRYDASSLGRFMTPDTFYKDSHVGDPQSWNEYAYARNNPLRYVDPSGENATVSTSCSRDANNHMICNANVSASIAIYAQAGSGISQDQLNQAAGTIKDSIQNAWTGSFSQDGVTYNVTTQVTVSVANSQEAAMSSGAQNVIGMTNGPITLPNGQQAGAYVNQKTLWGALTGKPDTGLMDINNADNYAKHEFTHMLGTANKPGAVLSNTDPAWRPFSATSQDYGWGIREATSGVSGWMNAPAHTYMRYGEVFDKPSVYSDQTTVGAPWHWWK